MQLVRTRQPRSICPNACATRQSSWCRCVMHQRGGPRCRGCGVCHHCADPRVQTTVLGYPAVFLVPLRYAPTWRASLSWSLARATIVRTRGCRQLSWN
jgi:hypothetical protein